MDPLKVDYENPRHHAPTLKRPWFGFASLVALSSTFGLALVKWFGSGIGGNINPLLFLAMPIVGLMLGIAGLYLDQNKLPAWSGVISNSFLLVLIAVAVGLLVHLLSGIH
jgi:hypothetical protein